MLTCHAEKVADLYQDAEVSLLGIACVQLIGLRPKVIMS